MLDSFETPVSVRRLLGVLNSCIVRAEQLEQSVGLIVIHIADYDRLMANYGYKSTNEAAAELARRLASRMRDKDVIIRISESRTAVIVNALRNPGVLVLAASKLRETCITPIQIADEKIVLNVHMGLASGPDGAEESETLYHNAETALLTAISEQTEFESFKPDQRERAGRSLQLESDLDKAISERAFEVHYQPKVAASSFRPTGAEALLRWNNPRCGFVPPDVFIPLADRPGRSEPLTSFVLSTAIRHAQEWPDTLPVSVNISTGMLLSSEFVEMVGNALGMWDFDPGRLCLEVTEGALMRDPEASHAVLRSLRGLGVRFSIDDFGTGYSSLTYFKTIPANELKIDKSFVRNMLLDDGDRRIVNAVVQLAKGFGMQVTAEGVEDEDTALALAQLGCDQLQGFYFARPMPKDQLVAWLIDCEFHQAAHS